MAYWKRCPECCETNYFQVGQTQTFDCGFKGRAFDSTREARCGGHKAKPKLRAPGPEPKGESVINDAAARYRLALLDAAKVADGIARDVEHGAERGDTQERCRALAEQMRAFAGHGRDPGASDDAAHSLKLSRGLLSVVKKLSPW